MKHAWFAIIDLILAGISVGGCLWVRSVLRQYRSYMGKVWAGIGYVLFSLFVLCGLAALAGVVGNVVIGVK